MHEADVAFFDETWFNLNLNPEIAKKFSRGRDKVSDIFVGIARTMWGNFDILMRVTQILQDVLETCEIWTIIPGLEFEIAEQILNFDENNMWFSLIKSVLNLQPFALSPS